MRMKTPLRISHLLLSGSSISAFSAFRLESRHVAGTSLAAKPEGFDRRAWLSLVASAPVMVTMLDADSAAFAGDFTPGGSLVDRSIGVQVGNPEASASRNPMNTNVLFDKDYYFKFGTAVQYIEKDSTDFPKTMPFTKSQQRYDNLKKYGDRVKSGIDAMVATGKLSANEIADPAAMDVYQLRPLGLLANGLLASENTGAPNELFVARWYINEMYLLIGDMRLTDDSGARKKIYESLKKAINSYLSMLNRVITAKVGEKFEYV